MVHSQLYIVMNDKHEILNTLNKKSEAWTLFLAYAKLYETRASAERDAKKVKGRIMRLIYGIENI